MRNANKIPKDPLFLNGEKYEKVIRNPHADADQHQKLITSRGSPLPILAQLTLDYEVQAHSPPGGHQTLLQMTRIDGH